MENIVIGMLVVAVFGSAVAGLVHNFRQGWNGAPSSRSSGRGRSSSWWASDDGGSSSDGGWGCGGGSSCGGGGGGD